MTRHVATMCATALVALSFPALALADGFREGVGPGHMWDGGYGYHGFFGPVVGLIILVAVIAGIVMLVKWAGCCGHGRSHRHGQGGKAALDILSERFARGEIDAAEYQERKRLLEEE